MNFLEFILGLSPPSSGRGLHNEEIKDNLITLYDGTTDNTTRTAERVIVNPNIILIPENAFNNCTSLKSIIFGNLLESIGIIAFSNCTSLQSI